MMSVKLAAAASGRAEADSLGTLAVWPLYPVGKTPSQEVLNTQCGDPVGGSSGAGCAVRSRAPWLFMGAASNARSAEHTVPHFGMGKTLKRLRPKFYWLGYCMDVDLNMYCCD